MNEDNSKSDAVRHIMATLFSAQNALRSLAPEFRWAGLGNLLGDYGEYVAIRHYGLTKAGAVSAGFDASASDGRTVQIKTNHSSSEIGFRGEADLMLVLKVDLDGSWEELYFGDFRIVKNLARYSSRDNKYMVHVGKLRTLSQSQGTTVREPSLTDVDFVLGG